MNISILGAGRWGSFIAWYLNRCGKSVTLWAREKSEETPLFLTRQNEYVELSSEINLTHNLNTAIIDAEVIIITISAQGLRELMETIKNIDGYETKKYCLCMKGIEISSGKRLSEVMTDMGISADNIAVWVGPGHIQEFVKGVPNLMIIDSNNKDLSKYLIDNFKSDLIRFYLGEDLIGTEIGAAAKNVMGIAAGMLDGGGYSVLKGALMARGAREISRLIKSAGGNELSAYGLCHLGDYEATLFSEHSHNRKFGEAYVTGEHFDKLAEGVKTATALLNLAEKVGEELPIVSAVNDIIINKKNAKEVLLSLFSRKNTNEF